MTINLRVRNLALAALSAAAVAGVSVAQVSAKPKGPTDNGVRCAAYDAKGVLQFYWAGSLIIARDANGKKVTLMCGDDGKWELALTAAPPSQGGPAGGGLDPTP